MNIRRFASTFALPLAVSACATSNSSDTSEGGGAADGSSIYFACDGLGTNNTVWLEIRKRSVVLTIEDVGVNTGHKTTSDATSKTYGDWDSNVYFGTGDTLVIPDSLITDGSGKVQWFQANVNPYWEGSCKQKDPTGDQCAPLVQQIYPIDSSATASYDQVGTGHYTATIPNSRMGDFVYDITMNVDGILCTQGSVAPVSCSAIVADAIETKALADGSSSGSPYVDKRSATTGGYSWGGGVHDPESGEFAYTVTTDSKDDGCKVTSITAVTP
jgi:hypothetical protein